MTVFPPSGSRRFAVATGKDWGGPDCRMPIIAAARPRRSRSKNTFSLLFPSKSSPVPFAPPPVFPPPPWYWSAAPLGGVLGRNGMASRPRTRRGEDIQDLFVTMRISGGVNAVLDSPLPFPTFFESWSIRGGGGPLSLKPLSFVGECEESLSVCIGWKILSFCRG